MVKKYSSPTVLYCFSPPVMIATFCIEIILAVFAVLRYRATTVQRYVVALLVFLSIFQLAEYFVCGGMNVSAMTWSRIGYVAITLLPALGLHLVGAIKGKSNRIVTVLVDVAAAGLVGFFVFAPAAVNMSVCAGNYVVFHLSGLNSFWYGTYYYGAILASLMAAAGGIEASTHDSVRRALRWFVAGVLAFLIPTATTNALDPRTLEGIPSIMCGFAILFALTLCFRVLPLTTKRR